MFKSKSKSKSSPIFKSKSKSTLLKKLKSKSDSLKMYKSNPNPIPLDLGKVATSGFKSKSGFGFARHWSGIVIYPCQIDWGDTQKHFWVSAQSMPHGKNEHLSPVMKPLTTVFSAQSVKLHMMLLYSSSQTSTIKSNLCQLWMSWGRCNSQKVQLYNIIWSTFFRKWANLPHP